jgi:hypothetical protein
MPPIVKTYVQKVSLARVRLLSISAARAGGPLPRRAPPPPRRLAGARPARPPPAAVSTERASAGTSSRGSLDLDDAPAGPPPLTAQQAARLTALRAGDPDQSVYALGVVASAAELAAALRTDLEAGLSTRDRTELSWREATFGVNALPPAASASLLELVVEALGDFTVRTLLAAGGASLALEFWLAAREGGQPQWIEGASILGAVAVVVCVTAGNNYQQEAQFRALQAAAAGGGGVRAVRDGREVDLCAADVLAGDLLVVEAGDVLSADAVLVNGFDVRRVPPRPPSPTRARPEMLLSRLIQRLRVRAPPEGAAGRARCPGVCVCVCACAGNGP